MDNRE